MNSWKKLLVPTPLELVVYSVLGAIILLAGNTQYLISSLLGTYETQSFNSLINDHLVSVNSSELMGHFVNVFIWAVIGAVAYIIVWAIINSISGIHNDVIIGTEFTQYQPESRTHYWTAVMTRSIFRLAAGLLLIALSVFVVTLVYPVSITLVRWLIARPAALTNWLWMLVAILAWVLVFYLYTVLLRLLVLRSRVFGN